MTGANNKIGIISWDFVPEGGECVLSPTISLSDQTLSAASRNYGHISHRCPEAFPLPAPGARGRLPLRYARDLRPLAAIPLDAISSSLHRPLIGTPRCAPWHRERKRLSHRGHPKGGHFHRGHSWFISGMRERSVPAQR